MAVYKDSRELDSAVKRIRKMEKSFDRARAAQSRLSKAAESFMKAKEDLEALRGYYGSEDWKKDFQADEASELPAELRRGVLSEDGVWDFFEENRELAETMKKLARELSKK